MLRMASVAAAKATQKRFGRSALRAASALDRNADAIAQLAALSVRCHSSSASDKKKPPVVQVLHQKAEPVTYAQVEQDIAAMQREIRDAYKYVAVYTGSASLEVGLSCRDAVKSHFGEKHPVFASTITNIALMYKNLGRMEEAVESYEYALQTYKESVGEQHASFATTLHNLGSVYRTLSLSAAGMERVNALHRALDCFEEALKIRKSILEPGHPDISLTMCNLGIIHWHNKQPEKAFQVLTEAKDLLERRVGPNSTLTALAMNNLAYVSKEARKYDEAVQLYEKVVAIRERVLGTEHNETIMARHNLAEAYRASGQEEKALAIQQQILDLFDADAAEDEHDHSKNR
ncbi:Kinesin light chain, partial [Globisporangium splendens]